MPSHVMGTTNARLAASEAAGTDDVLLSDATGDDAFGATDEIRVYKDEGDDEKQENLSEEKLGLVTETEQPKRTSDDEQEQTTDDNSNNALHNISAKVSDYLLAEHFPFGYHPLLSPYPYHNSTSGKLFPSHPGFGFYNVMYGSEPTPLTAYHPPPPAHCGIQPLYIDSKTGLARHSVYPPLPASRSSPGPGHSPTPSPLAPLYPTDLTQLQCFDLLSRASPFHCTSPYAPSLSRSPLTWFPPAAGLLPPYPHHSSYQSQSYPTALTTASSGSVSTGARSRSAKSRRCNCVSLFGAAAERWLGSAVSRSVSTGGSTVHKTGSTSVDTCSSPRPRSVDSAETSRRATLRDGLSGVTTDSNNRVKYRRSFVDTVGRHHASLCSAAGFHQSDRRRDYIKKPLNAFMLFMKEKRQRVIEECTLKESAAINQILGRKWHALGRAEQTRYYDMARKEKELHMQRHPGWSARDNYATHTKKKKKQQQQQQQHQQQRDVTSSSSHPVVDTAVTSLRVKEDPDRLVQVHRGRSPSKFAHCPLGVANKTSRSYSQGGATDSIAADNNRGSTNNNNVDNNNCSRTKFVSSLLCSAH